MRATIPEALRAARQVLHNFALTIRAMPAPRFLQQSGSLALDRVRSSAKIWLVPTMQLSPTPPAATLSRTSVHDELARQTRETNMTAQEQSTLKTLILSDVAVDAFELPAYRLLNDLGHDVSAADSADEAVEMLQQDQTDLVVVDADSPNQREMVSRITELPPEQQPRQLAIFSDALDESLSALLRKLSPARVHVLLKPLHMHGLLGVLRNIEPKA